MIEIIRDQSDDNIVVARVATTVGTILVMAEVELTGRSLILSGVHLQGDDVKANEVGVAGLRRMIQEAMEELGDRFHETSGHGTRGEFVDSSFSGG